MSFFAHKFFDISSSNYKKLLEQAQNDGDVTITVGGKGGKEGKEADTNDNTFKAHSLILSAQCSWFKAAISAEKEKDSETIVIDIPNISPFTFDNILKYLYYGEMNLNSLSGKGVFELLMAVDELKLHEILEFLQKFLLSSHNGWLQTNFFVTYKISLEHHELKLLHQYFDKIIQNQPDILFLAKDFIRIDKDLLISLIKREKLAMSEIDVWRKLILWGKVKIRNSKPLIDWNEEDFKDLKFALDQCLPLIRFTNIAPIDYYYEVRPYERILSEEIKEEIIRYHMTSCVSDPKYGLSPRIGNIDSTLITSIEAATIATGISKLIKSYRYPEIPYEFRLLLRGSQDGFNSETFRSKCIEIGPTVVIMRISGSRQIIGGYNPVKWKIGGLSPASQKNKRPTSQSFFNSADSFIFSFNYEPVNAVNGNVISRIVDVNKAIGNLSNEFTGPAFGDGDLVMTGKNFKIDKSCYCRKTSYKESILESTENFSVNEYEVFELMEKQTLSSDPFKNIGQKGFSFGFGTVPAKQL